MPERRVEGLNIHPSIPRELLRRTKLFAALTDTTVNQVLVTALEDYLSTPENRTRMLSEAEGMLRSMEARGYDKSRIGQELSEHLESLKQE